MTSHSSNSQAASASSHESFRIPTEVISNMSETVLLQTDQSFPPTKRLRCQQEFSDCFSNSQLRFRQDFLQVFVAHSSTDQPRLGLIIPKKNLKKSVHRNRLKRIIREKFRCWQSNNIVDVIVMLKQKIDFEILYTSDIHHMVDWVFIKTDQRFHKAKK